MNVDDYVFGYANAFYDTTLVLSTEFNAAIPATLGSHAKATDRRADSFTSGRDGMAWTDVAEVEGVGGITGFRATDNRKGTRTENLGDPKWRAPPGSHLEFKFYCTEPQRLTLTAGNFTGEIEITASDVWQSKTIEPSALVRKGSTEPMKDWAGVTSAGRAPWRQRRRWIPGHRAAASRDASRAPARRWHQASGGRPVSATRHAERAPWQPPARGN